MSSGTTAKLKLIAVVMLALLAFGCRSRTRDKVGLPPNSTVVEMHAVSSGDVFLLVASNSRNRQLYILRNGIPTQVAEGEQLSVFRRATSDSFVVAFRTDEGHKHFIVDGSGNRSAENVLPIGKENWPYCTASQHYLVGGTDRPNLKEDDPDYDPLGWTGVLVVDLETGKTQIWRVPSPTSYVTYSSRENVIYLSSGLNENASDSLVSVMTLDWKKLRSERCWRGTNFSSQESFAVPFLHEGGLDWEVYDTKSWKPLMNFKWNGSGPYLSYREWNPVREPLLLTELVSPETNGTNYLEVLDVRSGTKLLSIREVPEAASTWSRDGKNLLLYEKEGLTTVPVPNP